MNIFKNLALGDKNFLAALAFGVLKPCLELSFPEVFEFQHASGLKLIIKLTWVS